MSLWESAMQPCTLFELKRVSDGEGGFASVYAPSAPFEAAIKLDSSTEARVAAKEGAGRPLHGHDEGPAALP